MRPVASFRMMPQFSGVDARAKSFGDAAEPLYRSLGYQETGVVPNFALDPDGRAYHGTTYMYKPL